MVWQGAVWGFAAVDLGLVAALAVVGAVGWQRTAPLRHGRPSALGSARGGGTSPTTLLAGWAGLATLGLGGALAARGRALGVAAVAAGAFVAASGFRARVIAVRAEAGELLIAYRRKPPYRVPWSEVRALRPPRAPVGGWVIQGGLFGRRTLMPSDVLGQESLLAVITVSARLEWDGQAWSRGPPVASPGVFGDRERDQVMARVPCMLGWTSQWK